MRLKKSQLDATISRRPAARWRLLPLCLAVATALSGTPAIAGPSGGEVTGGEGSISSEGKVTNIEQLTELLSIEWSSFDLNRDETVNFLQPHSSSLVLNQILQNGPSQIRGSINANGHVLLINPRGVIFGESATINVGAMTASTLWIDRDDFLNGDLMLRDVDSGDNAVVNFGIISAASGGVNLLGDSVKNEGLITAELGYVNLVSGREAYLTFDEEGFLGVNVTEDVVENLLGEESSVENTGHISAEGGKVILQANVSRGLFDSAVNNSGIIEATGFDNGAGGSVQLLGDTVAVENGSRIAVDGASGGGEILLGGSFQGSDPGISNAHNTFVGEDVHISADATAQGNGGEIIVWADEATEFRGNITARGGAQGGDGGFVEVSGKRYLDFAGSVDTTAVNGETGMLLLDPTDITIIDGTSDNDEDPPNDGDSTFEGEPPGGMGPPVPGVVGTVAGTDVGPSTIAESELEGIAATTNISLEATNNITVSALITDGALNLAQDGTASVTFRADSDGDGSGSFSMADTSNSIITAGGDVIISGENITVGDINAGTGDITLTAGSDITAPGTYTGANGSFNFGQANTGGTLNVTGATFALSTTASALGGTGTDTLQGDTSYSITGAGSGTSTLFATAWSAIEGLTGTAGDDSFTINGGSVANIDGLGEDVSGDTLSGDSTYTVSAANEGTSTAVTALWTGIENLTGSAASPNSFTFNAALSGTATGGADDDSFDLSGGGSAGTIDGAGDGTSGDEIIGLSTANSFAVTSGDGGTVNGNTFSNVENLTGGAAADNFSFSAILSGTAAGAGEDDTFDVSGGGTAGSIDGGADGAAGDTLIGLATANTFDVTSGNTGTLNTNPFSSVENLTGGAASDTFNLGAALTGTASGAGEDDSFDLSGGGSAGSIDGGGDGSSGDEIIGLATANTFDVTTDNSGTVNGDAFTGVENLTGGLAADSFTLSANLAGTAAGGAEDDTFDLSGGGSAGTIDGGGDGTAGDEIIGLATANTFDVTTDNSGTVNSDVFTGVENLTGGAAADSFTLDANLTGTAAGAGEDDSFDLSGGGTAGDIDGGGDGTAGDEIIGLAAANAFDVTTDNSGTVNGDTFSNVENLTGGAAADSFTFTALLAGTASGAGEDDTFTIEDGGDAGEFDGGAEGASGDEVTFVNRVTDIVTVAVDALTDIEILTGSARTDDTLEGTPGDDSFAIDSAGGGTVASIMFSAFETLSGLGGDDTFDHSGGGSVNSIDGGTNTGVGDTIIGLSTANTFEVTSADGGTLNGAGNTFSGVENLTGGAAADAFTFSASLTGTAAGAGADDTFTVDDSGDVGAFDGGAGTGDEVTFVNRTIVGADVAVDELPGVEVLTGSTLLDDTLRGTPGNDNFAINSAGGGSVASIVFSAFETLSGLAGDDTFDLSGGGSVTSIVGGANTGVGDTIIGLNTANTFVVGPVANAGTANGNAFSDIENLTGGAAADSFTLNAALSGTASGAGEDDTFNLSGGGTAGTIAGGANGASGDEIIGLAATANTFAVTSDNTGTVNGDSFTGVENLTGGTAADSFSFSANLAGTAAGGGDDDTFDLSGGGTAGTIDGGGNGASGDEIIGLSAAANTFVVAAAGDAGTVNGDTFTNAGKPDRWWCCRHLHPEWRLNRHGVRRR